MKYFVRPLPWDKIFTASRNPNKRYELVANGSHGKLTIYKAKEKIHDWIAEL
jgi:hypothetical protein